MYGKQHWVAKIKKLKIRVCGKNSIPLVVLSLADSTLPSEEREKVSKTLFETEKPAAFEKIKPSLTELSPEKQLVDCVMRRSR